MEQMTELTKKVLEFLEPDTSNGNIGQRVSL